MPSYLISGTDITLFSITIILKSIDNLERLEILNFYLMSLMMELEEEEQVLPLTEMLNQSIGMALPFKTMTISSELSHKKI